MSSYFREYLPLGQRPGKDLFLECGGLHKFMGWNRGLLTDSGGFQMVSLADLSDVTEEGVTFQSPIDGKSEMLTPEKSMEIQNAIGADIIMALDDVVSSVKLARKDLKRRRIGRPDGSIGALKGTKGRRAGVVWHSPRRLGRSISRYIFERLVETREGFTRVCHRRFGWR